MYAKLKSSRIFLYNETIETIRQISNDYTFVTLLQTDSVEQCPRRFSASRFSPSLRNDRSSERVRYSGVRVKVRARASKSYQHFGLGHSVLRIWSLRDTGDGHSSFGHS